MRKIVILYCVILFSSNASVCLSQVYNFNDNTYYHDSSFSVPYTGEYVKFYGISKKNET